MSGWPTKVEHVEVTYGLFSADGPRVGYVTQVVPDEEAIDKALIVAVEDTLRKHGATPRGKTTAHSCGWTGTLDIPAHAVFDEARGLAFDRFNKPTKSTCRTIMKFATPEVEAQYTAWRTSYLDTRRRLKLASALSSYKVNNCRHGWDCAKCEIDFMIDRAPTELARIDAEMAAESNAFVCKLEQRWTFALGRVPEPIVECIDMEFMVVGGTGPTYDAIAITLAPVDSRRGGAHYEPRITVPVAYLIEHGVMTAA